jgi:hypothetical protein
VFRSEHIEIVRTPVRAPQANAAAETARRARVEANRSAACATCPSSVAAA